MPELNLGLAYTGGIRAPLPSQVGYFARVDSTGVQIEYVPVEPGGLAGDLGNVDNAVLRADGTGGTTAQGSTATLSDDGDLVITGISAGVQFHDSDEATDQKGYRIGVGAAGLIVTARNDAGGSLGILLSLEHAAGTPVITHSRAPLQAPQGRWIGASPTQIFEDSGSAADEGNWRLQARATGMHLELLNDADSVISTAWSVSRTGAQVELLDVFADTRFNGTVEGITPTAAAHLATKSYVDSLAQGVEWQDSVFDRNLTAPPGGPSAGDRYIVAAGGSGAWSTHDLEIAEWDGAAWVFTAPTLGMSVAVDDENRSVRWNGSAWVFLGTTVDHGNLAGIGDDDHTIYSLVDGTRAYTGVVGGVTPTAAAHLTTKGYVDGLVGGGLPQPGTVTRILTSDGSGGAQESPATASATGVLSGVTVEAVRTGRVDVHGALSDPLRSTLSTTLTEAITIGEGLGYHIVVHASGTADTTGLLFEANAKCTVIRQSGGAPIILEPTIVISNETWDPAGPTFGMSPIAELSLAVTATAIQAVVTHLAGPDISMNAAGIAISGDRFDLDA